jgi:hypothetical protein
MAARSEAPHSFSLWCKQVKTLYALSGGRSFAAIAMQMPQDGFVGMMPSTAAVRSTAFMTDMTCCFEHPVSSELSWSNALLSLRPVEELPSPSL